MQNIQREEESIYFFKVFLSFFFKTCSSISSKNATNKDYNFPEHLDFDQLTFKALFLSYNISYSCIFYVVISRNKQSIMLLS